MQQMRSIDHSFYKSKEWWDCRTSYIQAHPLCERCAAKGLIVPAILVHHKIHLTPENVNDPSIALNHDNLESLCQSCHNAEHFGDKTERRWTFDQDGNLVTNGD